MSVLLEGSGLTKAYPAGGWPGLRRRPGLVSVDGVDLTIRAGEALGLVGESGCGKSTLCRMIARLTPLTSGSLRLCDPQTPGAPGQEIGDISPSGFARHPARRRIQMVFQDPSGSLYPRMTAFELIADPARQLLPGLTRAALTTLVEETAAAVSLPRALLGRRPHELSMGQKARVGIARALVVGPELLVLDEPTSALDVSVQAVVLRLLDQLRRERGIALFFVSHDLHLVRLLCPEVLVMREGQIVERGPAAAIWQAPRHPFTRALLSAVPRPFAGAVQDPGPSPPEPPSDSTAAPSGALPGGAGGPELPRA